MGFLQPFEIGIIISTGEILMHIDNVQISQGHKWLIEEPGFNLRSCALSNCMTSW